MKNFLNHNKIVNILKYCQWIRFFYFQVVSLALYVYFISALLGRQFVKDVDKLNTKYDNIDIYFPFFTTVQVNKLSFYKIILIITFWIHCLNVTFRACNGWPGNTAFSILDKTRLKLQKEMPLRNILKLMKFI